MRLGSGFGDGSHPWGERGPDVIPESAKGVRGRKWTESCPGALEGSRNLEARGAPGNWNYDVPLRDKLLLNYKQ